MEFLIMNEAGRKWDTLEEVERVTRRSSSGERDPAMKTTHQRTHIDQMDRRPNIDVTSSQHIRSGHFESASGVPSPPGYYSNK